MKKLDLVGKKFGRLTVLRFSNMNKHHKSCFVCKCDCGNEIITVGAGILSGNTLSCGCLKKDTWQKVIRKHNLYNTKLYKTYHNMKNRCNNKDTKDYYLYGGRGIKICKEWSDPKNGFINFYEWSLKNGFGDKMSIDRIDVNGDYSPENCRWATTEQQARNKRTNHLISYNGETHCIREWEELLGVNKHSIQTRITNGWDIKSALTKNIERIKKGDANGGHALYFG